MITSDALTVQQVAELTGLSEHTLRYYERIGLLAPVGRAANGHRRYTADDLRLLEFLIKLRSTGMPVEQMKAYADLIRQGPGNETERVRLLAEHRVQVLAHLEALMGNLTAIEYKIARYKEICECVPDVSAPAE